MDSNCGQVPPPDPLSKDSEAWVREAYQRLYWQVMEGRCVTFNCVVQAWNIANLPPDETPDRIKIKKEVSQFLEYYALKRFSKSCGGLRKIMLADPPLCCCALTCDDQVHAVMNSRNPNIASYADEILELSRDTHRVFQEADSQPAALIKWIGEFQWIKKAKNRRIANAQRNRRDAAEMLYSILTRIVLAASAIEKKEITKKEKREELRGIRQQWKDTRARVNGRIQRHARFEYATGVFWGTLISIVVLAGLGFLAAHFGGVELNGHGDTGSLTAATIGGTVGAFISVTQRLTRSTLLLDFTASRLQKVFLGTLRPAVGAVFGAFVYFAIIGGILAIQSDAATAHQNSAVTLAFFAVAGFVSGFSERFAAGVLENAGSAVVPAPWGMQEADRTR